MKELKLENPIEMELVQFECPGCLDNMGNPKKTYINKEDFNPDETLDCPFCNIHGIKHVRTFEIVIHKVFEK